MTSEVLTIPSLPNKILGVTWDANLCDRNAFIVYDEHDIFTYIYVKYSIYGSSVQRVGSTSLVSKQTPLLMHAGEVMSATSGGQLTQLNLSTHDTMLLGITDRDQSVLDANFNKQIALHRYQSEPLQFPNFTRPIAGSTRHLKPASYSNPKIAGRDSERSA